MTDLVQKLVGALERVDAEWSSFWPLGPDVPASSDRICAIAPETAEIWRTIRAALSEAKAGGWQDISTAPEGTMILCANMNAREARDWCFVAWLAGGKVCGYRMDKPTHWQPLPAPPAQRGEG